MWWRSKKIKRLENILTVRLKKLIDLTEIVDSNMARIKELEEIAKIRTQQIDEVTNILEEQTIRLKNLEGKLNKISN